MANWEAGVPKRKGEYCLVYRSSETGKLIIFKDTFSKTDICFYDSDLNRVVEFEDILAHKTYPNITEHWLKNHLGVKR